MTYKRLIIMLLVMVMQYTATVSAAASSGSGQDGAGIATLCYHDIGKLTDAWAVTPARLREHFQYIKDHGYTPISFDQYIAAVKHGAQLPAKPVMLTFDDGYLSFYTEVYPLLKEYNYPAVLAIVTSWLSEHPPAGVSQLVTWPIVRELDSSGLVTIASHSHRSHRFVEMTPQEDLGRSMEVLEYSSVNGKYETLFDYQERVRADLAKSQAIFKKELGHTVKALMWPYGSYTHMGVDIALEEGFEACFELTGGFNVPGQQAVREAKRKIIMDNPTTAQLADILKTGGKVASRPMNASYLSLDFIYDAVNPAQTEENLQLAIDRLSATGINTVFLQAFSSVQGSNSANKAYFHTTAVPVKADIFGHIVSRLKEERLNVYAWLPVSVLQEIANQGANESLPGQSKEKLLRLSADLAAYSFIDGALFQDEMKSADKLIIPEQTFIDISAVMRQYRPSLVVVKNGKNGA